MHQHLDMVWQALIPGLQAHRITHPLDLLEVYLRDTFQHWSRDILWQWCHNRNHEGVMGN